MKQKKVINRYFVLCLLSALMICVAQVVYNTYLIIGAIAFFLITTMCAANDSIATPVLLFFLPWSTIIKLEPGGMSFYTIALVIVCVVCFVKNNFGLNTRSLCLTLFILLLTLISKLMDGSPLALNYVLFIFLLLLFPIVSRELWQSTDFKTLTVFFSVGIIMAALSAQQLAEIPTIAKYIDVYNWDVITRLSGYYGDANFYSAHISAVFSGVLLLILREEKKVNIFGLFILAIALLYCGFISASKAFAITIAIVSVMWFFAVLSLRGRTEFKVYIIFASVVAAFFIATSGVFTSLIDIVMFRFNQSNNAYDFTTGRTERWSDYINAIITDAKLLLVGKGYNNIKINDMGSHNTPLQIIYQFGIIGGTMLASWIVTFIKTIFGGRKGKAPVIYVLIMLTGAFLPWMSIDQLFFDEFFLMPMYVCTGILYFFDNPKEKESIEE